jgi:hypothetical protein
MSKRTDKQDDSSSPEWKPPGLNEVDSSQDAPAMSARDESVNTPVVVKKTIEHKYVSAILDSSVSDLGSYDELRSHEVDSQLAFLDSLTDPLEKIVERIYDWMRDPSKNPFAGIRMPNNLSQVSLQDLQNLLGDAMNAYAFFGEARSIVNALARTREILHERRKSQSLMNEGKNAEDRKALAYLRSDPEYLMLARTDMLKDWVEQRYFVFSKMVDSIQQLITTKSVEASREAKSNTEWTGQ